MWYAYFALAYLAQGISCQFGLIAQPSQYFMMKTLGFNAEQISFVAAAMMAPWIIKPVYGLLSDAVPLFGYRRKSYIITSHVLAAVGMLCLSVTSAPYMVLAGLIFLAIAMAIATALFLGLAAEKGQADGNTSKYVSAQSFYYYMGNIGAVMLGGFLCQSLLPAKALSTAALIALVPVAITCVLSITMIREEKSVRSIQTAQDAWSSIICAAKQRRLWIVGAFAFLWNFTPSFGVPLYFHETNNLFFEQSLIGQLTAWNALGMMLGAVAYRDLIGKISLRRRVAFVVALWVGSIGSYAWLSTPQSGYFIELFRGLANTVELLCLYELASASCNEKNAVSVMAFLLASRNIANSCGTMVGGNLFTRLLHQHYEPLIWVGLVAPLVSLLLIPYLVQPTLFGIKQNNLENGEHPRKRRGIRPSNI